MTHSAKLSPLFFDGTALKCPLLFVTAKLWLKKLKPQQTLRIVLLEQTAINDIRRYLQKQEFEFTLTTDEDKPVEFTIIGKDN